MSILSKLFSKKFRDEPFKDQREEVEKFVQEWEKFSGSKLKLKEGCDQINRAEGEFGRDVKNPIPVNGVWGEKKYLNRLRCWCGEGLIFHRACSTKAENNENQIDIYETVCRAGKHWDTLFMDMYYMRRSTLIPKGYHFSKFDPLFSKLTIGFGTHNYCNNFPFGMPDCIAKEIGGSLGEKFAKRLEIVISDRQKFVRLNSPKKTFAEV